MPSFDLTLKPAQIEIALKPNTIFTQAYEVTNNSSETLLLSTSISSWIPADNLGTVSYLDNLDSSLQFSLSNSDLKLGQDFILSPNQRKQLVLKINNPSFEENDHYLTFFIVQKPLSSLSGNQQNLAKIGSHLLISTTSQDTLTSNLQISQLLLKPRIKDIFTPLKINGEIFNNSLHYAQIDGQVNIYKNNKLFWQKNLFPYTVASKNSRLIHCLNSQNEASTCQLKIPLWPGSYQGNIILNGNTSKYEYSFHFYIFPYSIIIAILVIFSLLIFFLKKKKPPIDISTYKH